jgi:recombinational DNA repair protein (RecF pathway)
MTNNAKVMLGEKDSYEATKPTSVSLSICSKPKKLTCSIKPKGIVFRFTKYGETSIIVNIFTEVFGLQSYIVNGVRSSSKRSKIALFQPLTLLDLVVYYKENANILANKGSKMLSPLSINNARDIRKVGHSHVYRNEVLNKAVKEQSHTEEIHNFMFPIHYGLLDTQLTKTRELPSDCFYAGIK